MKPEPYYETKKCRCIVEYGPHLTNELYLIHCGIEYCAPNKSWGPDKRPGWHLHLVLSGEGTLEVGGQQFHLHNGQMFLNKPYEKVHYYPNRKNPWTYCWVSFDGEKAAEYMEQAGFGTGINTQNYYLDPQDLYHLADKMMSKPTLQLSSSLRRFGLLNQFISLAIESHRVSGCKLKKASHSSQHYIDYAKEYIETNYSAITVADVAEYLGITRNYLTDLFREHVGISPRTYLTRVRLTKSAQLLADTDLPVRVVAEFCGYEDPLTFSRAFKNAFGISPMHYRENPASRTTKLLPL